jgi:hypothetical protein
MALDDESFNTYLTEKGLTAAECIERSPSDLMGWIAQREKIGYDGPTNFREDAVERFFRSYEATLRPSVDAHYPKAKALREPLRELHRFIFDFMQSVTHDRTYVTPDRIAAYTEHVLQELYSDGGELSFAAMSHPTIEEVAAYARIEAALRFNSQIVMRPNYARYSTGVLRRLKEVEAIDPAIPVFVLQIFVVHFIDGYKTLLEP